MRFYFFVVYRKGGTYPKIVKTGLTVADTPINAMLLVQKDYQRADGDFVAVSEMRIDATDDVG
jgi:hypothetical protein